MLCPITPVPIQPRRVAPGEILGMDMEGSGVRVQGSGVRGSGVGRSCEYRVLSTEYSVLCKRSRVQPGRRRSRPEPPKPRTLESRPSQYFAHDDRVANRLRRAEHAADLLEQQFSSRAIARHKGCFNATRFELAQLMIEDLVQMRLHFTVGAIHLLAQMPRMLGDLLGLAEVALNPLPEPIGRFCQFCIDDFHVHRRGRQARQRSRGPWLRRGPPGRRLSRLPGGLLPLLPRLLAFALLLGLSAASGRRGGGILRLRLS